jgi:hypothetical protein
VTGLPDGQVAGASSKPPPGQVAGASSKPPAATAPLGADGQGGFESLLRAACSAQAGLPSQLRDAGNVPPGGSNGSAWQANRHSHRAQGYPAQQPEGAAAGSAVVALAISRLGAQSDGQVTEPRRTGGKVVPTGAVSAATPAGELLRTVESGPAQRRPAARTQPSGPPRATARPVLRAAQQASRGPARQGELGRPSQERTGRASTLARLPPQRGGGGSQRPPAPVTVATLSEGGARRAGSPVAATSASVSWTSGSASGARRAGAPVAATARRLEGSQASAVGPRRTARPPEVPAAHAAASTPALGPERKDARKPEAPETVLRPLGGGGQALAATGGGQGGAPALGSTKLAGLALPHRAQVAPEQLGQFLLRRLSELPAAVRDAEGNWSLSLQLDPPELGRVEATLTLAPSGLHLVLIASTAAGRSALQEASHQISFALGGEVTVSANSGGPGHYMAGRHAPGRDAAGGTGFGSAGELEPGERSTAEASRSAARGADGGICLFV